MGTGASLAMANFLQVLPKAAAGIDFCCTHDRYGGDLGFSASNCQQQCDRVVAQDCIETWESNIKGIIGGQESSNLVQPVLANSAYNATPKFDIVII